MQDERKKKGARRNMIFLRNISRGLYKHYFSLCFRNPKSLETFLDAFFDRFLVIRKFHIDDGFKCFYSNASGCDFDRFYIVHKLSFSEFCQTITNRIPGERGYDGRIACL